MKREIVCRGCSEPWVRCIGKYPGEYIKVVHGTLKLEAICDGCNAELNTGNPASAVSVWTDSIPYFQWEHEYLVEMKELDAKAKTFAKVLE